MRLVHVVNPGSCAVLRRAIDRHIGVVYNTALMISQRVDVADAKHSTAHTGLAEDTVRRSRATLRHTAREAGSCRNAAATPNAQSGVPSAWRWRARSRRRPLQCFQEHRRRGQSPRHRLRPEQRCRHRIQLRVRQLRGSAASVAGCARSRDC